MNKKKYLTVALLFLTVSLIIVSVGLYLTGALPQGITNAIQKLIGSGEQNRTVEVIGIGSGDLRIDSAPYTAMPENIIAVGVDLTEDFSSVKNPSAAYNDVLTELSGYFDCFRNFRADTLFITPDYLHEYTGAVDQSGNQADLLREVLKYGKSAHYYNVLVLNDDCIYVNGQISNNNIRYYIENYEFDAVLLNSNKMEAEGSLFNGAQYFGNFLKSSYFGRIKFGVSLPNDTNTKYASQDTVSVLNTGLCDFAVIQGTSMRSNALPFGGVLAWWNSLAAQYPDVTFYCEHKNDLVCSNQSEWSSSVEICDQFRALWDCENICGSILRSASALRKNVNSSSVRLSYLLFEGAYKDLTVSSISVDSNNNQVIFTGKGAQGHKTICNKTVVGNSGAFIYRADLHSGKNTFRFFNCGKTLEFNVYNNTQFIYSYFPQETLYAIGDSAVIISAVCLSGASVRCSVGGAEYMMTPSSNNNAEIPAGYQFYSCQVAFAGNPQMDTDMGNVTFTATLQDRSEYVSGAKIVVLHRGETQDADEATSGIAPSVRSGNVDVLNQFTYGDVVSPYKNNGLGTAMLCKILKDDTEQLGVKGEKDTFHADNSTLCAGMFDYLKSIEVTDGGNLWYVMQSGITVYGTDCELINNGYVMPLNRIAVSSVDDTAADATDITFNIDWFSPVTVRCLPQTYNKGYESYSYNVSEFSPEYIDVRFFYSKEFYNTSMLTFDNSSVFSHAELYKEGDNNLILRLYLKKQGQFYGFDMYRNDSQQLVISFKKRVNGALQGKTIMIDPGHGGLAMTGTAVADNSVAEKTVTLSIAYKLKAMLESKGAAVVLTRTSDTSYTLEERAEILCRANPDIYVSIHCDGTDNPADSGTHTFYFRPYSQPLAKEINAALANVYKTKIYSSGDPNYAKVDKKIKFYPFYVTRMDNCPSVLVETGFLTNPTEGNLLSQDNTQYWLASGIFNGIEAYFNSNH